MKNESQESTVRFLEKFRKRRLRLEMFPDTTDLQRLRIAEKGYCHFILLLSICLVIMIGSEVFSAEIKNSWVIFFGGFLIIVISYFSFELIKIRHAIDLFLEHAPQTIDLLLQRRNEAKNN